MLEKLSNSQFLTGDNDRGWKASFDFLLQEKSFLKLLEGAYSGTAKNQQNKRKSEGIDAGKLIEEAMNA